MTLTAGEVRRLLEERGIDPTKALGQNFVVDANTVRRIVRLAGAGAGDGVIEVGPGLGSLTTALADAGAHVVAVEIDARLVEALRQVVGDRPISVIHADALQVSWDEVLAAGSPPARPGAPWLLVANLPYSVATPVVIRVLEEAPAVGSLLVMVQREVGERIAARAGEDAYGAVSVKVTYWSSAAVVGRVPRSVFVPRPRVESVLVRLVRRPRPVVDPATVSYERLFEVVRAGFAQRRKMLRRALDGVVSPQAFAEAGVRADARAEEIDVCSWGRLAACPRT